MASLSYLNADLPKKELNPKFNSLVSNSLTTQHNFTLFPGGVYPLADGLNIPDAETFISGVFIYQGALASQLRSKTSVELAALTPDPTATSYFIINTYCIGVGSLEV